MRIVLILVMLVVCFEGFGQTGQADSLVSKRKTGYFFSVQTGAIIGDQVDLSFSTIHGFRIGKKLRLGAGIGFDSFKDVQVAPVFGSASWDLFGKKNVVFVQANYGWVPFAWSPTQKDVYGFDKASGGEMFSAMLGYRIAYGNARFAVMAGFRHQDVKTEYKYPYYFPTPWSSLYLPDTNSTQAFSRNMNRFALTLSAGWK